MSLGSPWTLPRAVLEDLLAAAREKLASNESVEDRAAGILLDQLELATREGQDPEETQLNRAELRKRGKAKGFALPDNTALNPRLGALGDAAAEWIKFDSPRNRKWWGRLIGPTAAKREDAKGDQLYFMPEAFPESAVLHMSRAEGLSIESANVLIGNADDLMKKLLFPLLPTASEIDLVNAYHVNEWVRDHLEEFRENEKSVLRACFLDVVDECLVAVFRRKVHDRSEEVIRDRVSTSIQQLLRCEKPEYERRKMRLEPPKVAPRAKFSIYLTPQRITYTFCRVDDQAIIVPLDVKMSQDPRPPAWAMSRAAMPNTFDYYMKDINALFEEARLVYPTSS